MICRGIGVGDRNGDTIQEIYVAGSLTDDSRAIFVHDGIDFTVLQTHPLPVNTQVRSLVVADVDGDNTIEIAFTHQNGLMVLDATTFTVE